MHLEEFSRAIGLIFVVLLIGAVAWIVSQVAPEIERVATLPARVEVANAKNAAAIAAIPTHAALDVKERENKIASDAAKAKAETDGIIEKARADSAARIIEANGMVTRDRALGQAAILIASAVILLVIGLFVFGGLTRRDQRAISERVWKTLDERGGQLVLANHHAVILPARGQKMLSAGIELPENEKANLQSQTAPQSLRREVE